ncbi:hypothetical protein INT46_000081 [Mucor plumbeus]|uniref:Uncharacterized protein n=1 Tax=Mucor plumbeus TaxID=97098 RepID=A0A8H7UXZ2_9FUNG|nr:hypothetical protein INT46_000081 [Mucor plumbeus]
MFQMPFINQLIVTFPTAGTVWKVGQRANVSFEPGQNEEMVSVFFNNDRESFLGGGSVANGGTFQFTVPQKAVSLTGGFSELIAVHRINGYLQSVDNVKVRVIN